MQCAKGDSISVHCLGFIILLNLSSEINDDSDDDGHVYEHDDGDCHNGDRCQLSQLVNCTSI